MHVSFVEHESRQFGKNGLSMHIAGQGEHAALAFSMQTNVLPVCFPKATRLTKIGTERGGEFTLAAGNPDWLRRRAQGVCALVSNSLTALRGRKMRAV